MIDDGHHWQVTLIVGGSRVEPRFVQASLHRLSELWPVLELVHYGPNRAEVRFWEEGESTLDVARLGVKLWDENRDEAGLHLWQVRGIEVVDASVARERRTRSASRPVRPT